MNDFFEKAETLKEKLGGVDEAYAKSMRAIIEARDPPADDPVDHPPHYTRHPSGVECIQITEHMNFNLGNVVKYVWRADGKGGVEDLRKAAWYLAREIARLEGAAA